MPCSFFCHLSSSPPHAPPPPIMHLSCPIASHQAPFMHEPLPLCPAHALLSSPTRLSPLILLLPTAAIRGLLLHLSATPANGLGCAGKQHCRDEHQQGQTCFRPAVRASSRIPFGVRCCGLLPASWISGFVLLKMCCKSKFAKPRKLILRAG